MSPAAPGPSSASQGASTLVNSYDAQCLAHGSTALSTEAMKGLDNEPV